MKSIIPWFYLIAATGSPIAYALSGVEAYRQGNYPLAAQELKSQSGKDPFADYYLGRMRLYGYGQLKNNALALRYFSQAAEKGILPAQQILGRYFLIEAKNPEEAIYWFKKAADQNDIPSQMYCAAAYLFGLGVKKNEDTARRYFIDAAKNGNSIAQYTLGMYFLESRDQNSKKLGVIWLTKAAMQNNINAKAKLGELYLTGTLVSRDETRGFELLKEAAKEKSNTAMVFLAELAIKQNQIDVAKNWLNKAIESNPNEARAEMLLGRIYADPKSPIYDLKTAFMWTLQAAQKGAKEAEFAVAQMYKEGKGVEANLDLAVQWELKAKDKLKEKTTELKPEVQAARWLSNNKSDHFENETYSLGGIYSAWKNELSLRENNYNAAPRMETITRAELYKPNFVMAEPRNIPINDYFDVIAPLLNASNKENLTFPRYPLDAEIEALQQKDSLVVVHKASAPIAEAIKPDSINFEALQFNHFKEKPSNDNKAKYQAIINKLYNQAILGNSDAQFEIGQLYQYGIAVAKNPQQAITYYQLAAAQQDIRAEYNLGLLYLQGQTSPVDYKQGLNWMTDAAFKGNVFAQYALARIYENGFSNEKGEVLIKPDIEQALGMYYLSSSNGFGPAQYRLADYLVKQKQFGLSVAAKQNRTKLIRRLYQGAVKEGIAEAALPLAYYNAIDYSHPEKQKQAYQVAKEEASKGNSEAALLLAMMLERGITVKADQNEALFWYQKAASNPVTSFILGTYYSLGQGLRQDLNKGKTLLQSSANSGFTYAHLNLAVLKEKTGEEFLSDLDAARKEGNSTAGLLLADYYLSQGNESEKIDQAKQIYHYFAEKGDKEAQLKLGFLFDAGIGVSVNHEQAAKWYLAAAEQGQTDAQFLLGQLYQFGYLSKEPDYSEAKKWYAQAQKTNPKAAVSLGFIYDTVDDNYQKALDSYQIAANDNDAIGQFDLALIYAEGKGVPVNNQKAAEFFSKAAGQNLSGAMTKLAELFLNGLGLERNTQRAFELYQKAAAAGDADALYQLGLLSETGIATPLDFATAINYYTQAAAKGNEKAKLALARIYQYGLGVVQNTAQAKSLYGELAANHNGYAQYQLALMELNSQEHKATEAKNLLEKASENGNLQARKMLQWLESQQQERVSYIEPISIKQAPILAEQPADLLYFDALSEWNRGNEESSRLILNHLMTQFPHYGPAKRAFEQLNQLTSLSSGYNEAKND